MDQKRLEAALAAGLARLRAPPDEALVDVVPAERGGGGERRPWGTGGGLCGGTVRMGAGK